MPNLAYLKGDLIELARQGKFRAIGHGANCFHLMGAGIAKQIARHFPAAFTADRKTEYGGELGKNQKLGSFSCAEIVPDLGPDFHPFTVYNLYTQHHPGRGDVALKYWAIESAFAQVAYQEARARTDYRPFGIPRIGCGIAGLDWGIVERLIYTSGLEDVVVVDLP